MGKAHKAVVFKSYDTSQAAMFPPLLEEFVPADHPVRVVRAVIESITIDPLLEQYTGGGASSYDPRMMLSVLVYAYLCNIYSSRQIEAQLRENVHFMWLAGRSTPDHNTINRFRGDRLKGVLKEVFSQIVQLLVESGHLSLKEVYVDGTKIEANANRYTAVWAKGVATQKGKLLAQIAVLWNHSLDIARAETAAPIEEEFGPINAASIAEVVKRIDENLAGKEVPAPLKRQLAKGK